jgi:hypothetical protein
VGSFGHQIAVDEAGAIYVVMACQTGGAGGGAGGAGGRASGGSSGAGGSSSGGAVPAPDAGAAQPPIGIGPMGPNSDGLVAVSTDGGKTFTKPRPLSIAQSAGDPQVAAGAPGLAYVLAQGPDAIRFTRTEDGGATWTQAQPLSGLGGTMRMAAAGKRVVIAGQGAGAVVLHSDDGGRTLSRTDLDPLGTVQGIQVQADGVVWLYLQAMLGTLMKSTDGGATFASAGEIAPGSYFDNVAFGSQSFFGTSGDSRLMVGSLASPDKPRFVDGLSQAIMGPRALIADSKDGVVVLDPGFDGTIQARRLEPGATSFSTARSVGPFEAAVSGVALSEKAAALALWQKGQVMVTVQVWE